MSRRLPLRRLCLLLLAAALLAGAIFGARAVSATPSAKHQVRLAHDDGIGGWCDGGCQD